MNKKAFLGLLFIIIVGILYTQLAQGKKNPQMSSKKLTKWNIYDFYQPVKTKHFVSSSPGHGVTVKEVIQQVTLTFDKPLAEGSHFTVDQFDENYAVPPVQLTDDRLTMKETMEHGLIDGMYVVNYTACFDSEECQRGYYRFLLSR